MAVKGYCDCTEGSVDSGEGVCDKALFNSIQSANSILTTGSASIFLTSLALGTLTANPFLAFKFVSYNQIIGQLSYFNTSVSAAIDSLYNSSAKYNLGRLLQGFSSQKITRRLLYDNSTQSVESLFLHGSSQYSTMLFVLVVIGVNLLLWFMIAILRKLSPLLKARYKFSQQPATKALYKMSAFGLRVLKFGIPVYMMQLTLLESSFDLVLSAKLAFYGSPINAGALAASCILFLYYVAFSLFLTAKALKIDLTNSNNRQTYSSLFSNFDTEKCSKWHCRIFFSITILKVIVLQVWLVTLSFSPFAQSLAWAVTQLLYTLYLIIVNPFEQPYSKLMVANELVMVAQFTTFCIMIVKPEGERLNYSLALIAIGYVQVAVFALFVLMILYQHISDANAQTRLRTLKCETNCTPRN